MNAMFNIHGLARSSKVSRLFADNLPDFQRIDWKYLSSIEIYRPFHINDLRTLVSKVPSLKSIHVYEMKIKENGELLPEIQDEATTVELIGHSLKSISFYRLNDCTESEKNKFIVYLSKLTPGD